MLAIPNGHPTGGNCRGENAVDLQTSRINASSIAAGNHSFLSPGKNNKAEGELSFVIEGMDNIASAATSGIIGGTSNTIMSGSTGSVIIDGSLHNSTNMGMPAVNYTMVGGTLNNAIDCSGAGFLNCFVQELVLWVIEVQQLDVVIVQLERMLL